MVLRDLGDKGNIMAVAQLLSRRDKVFNHWAVGEGEAVPDMARQQ